MGLKVITIDFWNTLFDSTNAVERNRIRNQSIKASLLDISHDISEKEIKDAISASWGYFNKLWTEEMRTPLPKESVEFFWDYLHLPKDEAAISKVVRSFETAILSSPPSLIQDAGYAVSALSKEYKLGIISDTGFTPGSVLKIILKEAGIFDFFSAFSFSDETNVAKPQPKAYLKILEELQVQPNEALHIGDIEQTDIKGAKALGMKAIRFSGDPSNLSKPNTVKTAADFECFNWNEVVIAIHRLEVNQ